MFPISLTLGLRQARVAHVQGSFSSLRGVNTLLSTSGGSLAAWAYLLALDLFTGAWIYRQPSGRPGVARYGWLLTVAYNCLQS